jgi:hypothetical protein
MCLCFCLESNLSNYEIDLICGKIDLCLVVQGGYLVNYCLIVHFMYVGDLVEGRFNKGPMSMALTTQHPNKSLVLK